MVLTGSLASSKLHDKNGVPGAEQFYAEFRNFNSNIQACYVIQHTTVKAWALTEDLKKPVISVQFMLLLVQIFKTWTDCKSVLTASSAWAEMNAVSFIGA